jgi:DNA mismatch repair protein MutS2
VKYPQNFEQTLGFDRIRESLVELCRYQVSRNKVVEMEMATQENELTFRLDALGEAIQIQDQIPSFFLFAETDDIGPFLPHLAIENFALEEMALFRIAKVAEAHLKAHRTLSSRSEEFPLTLALFPAMPSMKEVALGILAAIDEQAQLKPQASPLYAKLSGEITRLEREGRTRMRQLYRQYKELGYTAETEITVREERLVLPIIAEHKRKVKGFVKDISATGKVLYIEPGELLELNNHLKELFAERRRERDRILRSLTKALAPFKDDLLQAMHGLGEADFRRAKADWVHQQSAERPELDPSNQGLKWIDAVHPGMRSELQRQNNAVIPLNLDMGESRLLVVSGPNAGGKSVVLKTILLLQYMLQCGLYVTARSNSRLGLFDVLAIDCGDGQSLEEGLSTFSAHLQNLNAMLAAASSKAMLGFDEVGAGTDPRFGAPIAQAVMETLSEKGAFAIATTHFSQLREWGMDQPQVLQASMAYDARELKPLYRLISGKPGSSFALELMRKTGFDSRWMKRIEQLSGKQMGRTEDLMLQVERQTQELEERLNSVRKKEEDLQLLQAEYLALKNKLQDKRRDVLAQAKADAQRLMSEANQQIEQTIRVIREHGADKQKTQKARNELNSFKAKVETQSQKRLQSLPAAETKEEKPQPIDSKKLIPGLMVRSLKSDQEGELLELGKDKALVAFGLLKMWVPKTELGHAQSNRQKKKQARGTSGYNWVEKQQQFSEVLDVRGLRQDETLARVKLWLDEAYTLGNRSLKVVHGRGTGALKKALRELFKTLSYIKSFEHESEQFGGDGVTRIELL